MVVGAGRVTLKCSILLFALLGEGIVALVGQVSEFGILGDQRTKPAQLHADGSAGAHTQYPGYFALRIAGVTR